MSEKELQKSVEYQAKKYIPLPLTDVNLGWQILEEEQRLKAPVGTKKEDELAKMQVLITAVPKSVIQNYLKVVESAGLEVQALEIESLSLIRSLVGPEDRSGILILDIGAKSTILSIVYNGYLWATRHLSMGGDTITASIAQSMGVSLDRAEQMKRTSAPSGIQRNVVEIIKQEAQQIIRITENQGKKISKIILTGGGAKLPGLSDEFRSLASQITLGDPMTRVTADPAVAEHLKENGPRLAVAMGLAMRSL